VLYSRPSVRRRVPLPVCRRLLGFLGLAGRCWLTIRSERKGQLDLIRARSYYVNLAQRRRRQDAANVALKSTPTDRRQD